jgi:hypothetical protein
LDWRDQYWLERLRSLGSWNGTFLQTCATTGPDRLVAGDFNGDGLADLAASNRHSTGVSIYLARPDGTFQDQVQYRTGIQPWNILAGDFNEDGRLDLTTANARSHDVSILLGLGDGTFQQDPSGLRQGETNPQGMIARDFDGDTPAVQDRKRGPRHALPAQVLPLVPGPA